VINSSSVMNKLVQHGETFHGFREFHESCLVSGSSSGGAPTAHYGVKATFSVIQRSLGGGGAVTCVWELWKVDWWLR
jgi:hypothetical protein